MGASGSSVKTGSARRAALRRRDGSVPPPVRLLHRLVLQESRAGNPGPRRRRWASRRPNRTGQNLASLDALRKLETLRQSLETLVKYRREGAPWSYRWGLYTGDALYPEVRRIYFDRFRQLLFQQTQSAILENLRGLPSLRRDPNTRPLTTR